MADREPGDPAQPRAPRLGPDHDVVRELDGVTQAAHAAFGGLSADQLNWKPAPGSWSIAQCLDHLITINRLYFPVLESLGKGIRPLTLWERLSPFSGVFGRLLIRSLSPENPRRMKTNAKAEPSASRIDAGIVDRFARHQAELIAHLRALPSEIDGRATIVTSPLLRWVTYSLDDCLTILVVHEKRHLQQAQRVMQAGRFGARG